MIKKKSQFLENREHRQSTQPSPESLSPPNIFNHKKHVPRLNYAISIQHVSMHHLQSEALTEGKCIEQLLLQKCHWGEKGQLQCFF